MSNRHNEGRLDGLALAVASGQSIAEWCKENGVPRRTGYDWAARPEFRVLVKNHRRQMADAALGRLAKHVGAAVDQIASLAANAQNESVRLAAARAILAELIAIHKFSDLESRMAEVESMFSRPNIDLVEAVLGRENHADAG